MATNSKGRELMIKILESEKGFGTVYHALKVSPAQIVLSHPHKSLYRLACQEFLNALHSAGYLNDEEFEEINKRWKVFPASRTIEKMVRALKAKANK